MGYLKKKQPVQSLEIGFLADPSPAAFGSELFSRFCKSEVSIKALLYLKDKNLSLMQAGCCVFLFCRKRVAVQSAMEKLNNWLLNTADALPASRAFDSEAENKTIPSRLPNALTETH